MADNLEISGAEFQQKVLEASTPVLVDFWAPWCGPCRQIGPSIEQIATEFQGRASVYKINVDNDGDLAQQFGIMSIPALLVFKDGKVVNKQVGAAPKPMIEAMLNGAL